jgi:hypothetical protein
MSILEKAMRKRGHGTAEATEHKVPLKSVAIKAFQQLVSILRGSGALEIYNPALSLAANMKCSCGVTKSPQFCKRRSRGAASFDLNFF